MAERLFSPVSRYVIFDCDGCIDDAWALSALLKGHEEKHYLLLAVTVSGTDIRHTRDAAFNMYKTLEVHNHLEIPLFLGATNVFLHTTVAHNKPPFYGNDGFGDFFAEEDKLSISEMIEQEIIETRHAVDAMQMFCKQHPQRVTIISTGRLTNIALLFAWYTHYYIVKEIYIMGGTYSNFSKNPKISEYFFSSDPEATHVVFTKAQCPITVLPWDICGPKFCAINLTMNWRLNRFEATAEQSPAIRFLNEIETKQFQSCHYYESWNPGAAMLTAVYLFDDLIINKHYVYDVCKDYTGLFRGQVFLEEIKREYDEWNMGVRVVEELNITFFQKVAEWCAGLTNLKINLKKDPLRPLDNLILQILGEIDGDSK